MQETLSIKTTPGDFFYLEGQPHPWRINLSEKESGDKAIYQMLVELHISGKLQPGDKIIGFKSHLLHNINYFAKTFFGEYQVDEQSDTEGKTVQTLTRVQPVINANIHEAMPTSPGVLENQLETHGHIVIRSGKPVDEAEVLGLIKGKGKPMDYNRYGTTTRKQIKDSAALQVTPWDKEVILPAHNEMTHHTEFPRNMAFLCKEPAEFGGETAIYDCAKAFDNLSSDMQNKIAGRNVICRKRYVENSSDLRYLSWQQVLGENSSREQAIEHFTALGYKCHFIQEEEGKATDILEIRLVRPLVYQYRGKNCLHASMIPLTPFWYWQIWPGKIPPLMVTWENGEPLSYEEFYALDEAVLAARIRYDGWRKHDVLIIDNPRIAHGRLPYTGERLMGGLMAQPSRFIQQAGHWGVEAKSDPMMHGN
jgi:alpha-ketoglutarate-dependent taurine dioxygenase